MPIVGGARVGVWRLGAEARAVRVVGATVAGVGAGLREGGKTSSNSGSLMRVIRGRGLIKSNVSLAASLVKDQLRRRIFLVVDGFNGFDGLLGGFGIFD